MKQNLEEIEREQAKLEAKFEKAKMKQKEILRTRYQKLYPNVDVKERALDFLVNLDLDKSLAFERKLSYLQHGSMEKIQFRDQIHGTKIKEIAFTGDGRIYVELKDNKIIVHAVGDKSTQPQDIAYLRKTDS